MLSNLITRHSMLSLVLIAVSLQSAVAQNTPSVSAGVSGSTAIGTGATIPDSEWIPITVTRNDGTLHAEAKGDGGSFSTSCTIPCVYPAAFTSTSATGFASADPGVLRVFGSDLVQALPELNAPNVPVTPNYDTVYANINVGAAFTDYLTVEFPGKSVGTPVQVPFHYAAELVSNTVLGYPEYSLHPLGVSVSFNFTGLGPQNFSTENYLYSGFSKTTLPNGNIFHSLRSSEFFVDALVGDVITISAAISVFGAPRIINGNNSNGNGNVIGAWADGRNTAGIWLGTLPSGMVITSASGHDYSVDPTAGVTPIAPVEVSPTATAGDARAIISFTAPIGTGAAAITNYTVTSLPDGITATGTRSPIVVVGLANDTAYTFTMTTKNASGMSTVSTPSNSITPRASLALSSPSSPMVGTATAGNAQAVVSFTASANDGGSAITGYTLTSSPSGITAIGTASPITVTGLSNGVSYTFSVTARNIIGTSVPSSPSNSVIPTALTLATPPGIGIATAGDAQATVSFTAPTNDGGSPVTSYRVVAFPGGAFATGAASPITVTELTNGTAYTFTVKANNAMGESLPSAASNSVTPAATPTPKPTPSPTPTPEPTVKSGGGGSVSNSLLLMLTALGLWRRRSLVTRKFTLVR